MKNKPDIAADGGKAKSVIAGMLTLVRRQLQDAQQGAKSKAEIAELQRLAALLIPLVTDFGADGLGDVVSALEVLDNEQWPYAVQPAIDSARRTLRKHLPAEK